VTTSVVFSVIIGERRPPEKLIQLHVAFVLRKKERIVIIIIIIIIITCAPAMPCEADIVIGGVCVFVFLSVCSSLRVKTDEIAVQKLT